MGWVAGWCGVPGGWWFVFVFGLLTVVCGGLDVGFGFRMII